MVKEEELAAWDENAKAQSLDAVQFAEESNFPDKSLLDQFTYV